jgi:hypothetical protein
LIYEVLPKAELPAKTLLSRKENTPDPPLCARASELHNTVMARALIKIF